MPNMEPTTKEIKEQKIYQEMGLTDSEYELVCSILGREPNYTETGLFSVMWSEHCSYKNSKPVLRKFLQKENKCCKDRVKVLGLLILAMV